MNDQAPQTEQGAAAATPAGPFQSGFVALFGRPNVGKSTLLNKMLGQKVTITSDKPQTTRHQVRGVRTTERWQIVFVDTPGVGKPRSELGKKLNATAREASGDVDLVCFVIDARTGYGRGDAFLAAQLDPSRLIVVLNKIDGLPREQIGQQLSAVAHLDALAYLPVSARTGRGVVTLVDEVASRLPEGPHWYPSNQISDRPEPWWVAELVREQLLRMTRDELPHSIATRVTNWEETPTGPIIRVEILVERESQKGIVIGKGGEVLKQVGIKARRQMPPGTYLDLQVSVEKNWHHDADAVVDLGY